MTTKSIERQSYERRVPLEDAPIWRVAWHEEVDALIGELDVQECQSSRAWTTTQLRVTEREPYNSTGYAFLGLAAVTSVLGAVTWDSEIHKVDCGLYGCRYETPTNTFPKVMYGTSLALAIAGTAMALQDGDTSSEVVSTDDHSTNVKKSCFTGADLEELVVVARDDAQHIWPARLTSTGEVRIPLPQSPAVPRGAELELVVYRAPRHSGGLYRKGLVLNTFTLPASAPDADP